MRTNEHSLRDAATEFMAYGDDEPTRRFAESTLARQCLSDLDEPSVRCERPDPELYDTPVGAMPALVRMTAPGRAPMPPVGALIQYRTPATCAGNNAASCALQRRENGVAPPRGRDSLAALAVGMRRAGARLEWLREETERPDRLWLLVVLSVVVGTLSTVSFK